MIHDYSKYKMSTKERTLFYGLGYVALAFVIYLFYHSIILSGAAGLLIVKARSYYESYMASKQMSKLNLQFKDLLYSLSASISSGRHMSEAIVEAHSNLSVMYSSDDLIMKELSYMKQNILENNESDRLLLSDFAKRSCCEDIRNFVRVYIICRNLGGDLEKIISRASDILTDKMNIQREIQALTAQKKFEGLIIAFMPPVMLLILNLVSPSYIAPLYGSLAGRLIMTGCLAVIVWGALLIKKISRVKI